MHDLVISFLNKEYDKSQILNEKAIIYSEILFSEVNPIPVKSALYELGLIASDELRLPLTKMEEANVKKLRKIIKNS